MNWAIIVPIVGAVGVIIAAVVNARINRHAPAERLVTMAMGMVDPLSSDIAKLRQEGAERDVELRRMRDDLTAKDRAIAALQGQLAEMRLEVARRDAEIAMLHEHLGAKPTREQYDGLVQRLALVEEYVRVLQQQIEASGEEPPPHPFGLL